MYKERVVIELKREEVRMACCGWEEGITERETDKVEGENGLHVESFM